MSKYLLRFNKKGNMRFLSHLDLGRLFRRAIKKAEIDVLYSNGFNPHERINIVQPLSLGFESESEYFEISTGKEYAPDDLLSLLNASMPEGIAFYSCKEIDDKISNVSKLTDAARYVISYPLNAVDFERINIDDFLNQNDIVVMKRDKKTKSMVEKSVKSFVYSILKNDEQKSIYMLLRCASNETLNPINLLESLFRFSNIEFKSENARVTRIDLYTIVDREFVSLSELV